MSWDKIKLGEVCTIEKGTTGILKAIPGEFPMVVTGKERKSHNEFQFDDEAVIVPLVSGTGHGHASIKRIHFQKGKFALGSILCAIIPKDKTQLSAEYLYRFLDLNKEDELVARMKGMANVTLPLKEIAQIEIPLPSLIEQKEFVENYEILETQSDLLSTELTHQLFLVKKLRQQLLQDAVQGKLVEQNKKDEPASELLKKIKAERLNRDAALARPKKEKELAPIKPEEIPFEIPENWVWCRLGEITDVKRGKSPIYSEIGISKMLNQKCVRWYELDLEHSKLISESWYNSVSSDFKIKENDVLVNSTGEGTIGRSALASNYANDYLFDSHILKISSENNQKLLCYYINSNFGQSLVEKSKGATSTKQTELGVNNLSNFIFPLPPLAEQNRIVQKLNSLMKYCDDLELSIKQSASQNGKLLQQVLREALRKEPVEEAV